MLKKSKTQFGKRTRSTAENSNSSTPNKSKQYLAQTSDSSASGDDEQSAGEDEEELSSNSQTGSIKFDCRKKGKVKPPACKSATGTRGRPTKTKTNLSETIRKQKSLPLHLSPKAVPSGLSLEDNNIHSLATTSGLTPLNGGSQESDLETPAIARGRSDVKSNQQGRSVKGKNITLNSSRNSEQENQTLDQENNEFTQDSSSSKGKSRPRGVNERDTSANTDVTLVNTSEWSLLSGKVGVSKGVATSEGKVGKKGEGKFKSKAPSQQKENQNKQPPSPAVPTGPTASKKTNKHFKQQINMAAKGSTKSVSVDISLKKSKAKTTGNQTQNRYIRSLPATAERPVEAVKSSKNRLAQKSSSKNKDPVSNGAISIGSESNKKIHGKSNNSKSENASVKGATGTPTKKDAPTKKNQNQRAKPVDSDDWLGFPQTRSPSQVIQNNNKIKPNTTKVAFNENDAQKTKSPAPPLVSQASRVLNSRSKTPSVKVIEATPRKGTSSNNGALATSPSRPSTRLRGNIQPSAPTQIVSRTSPSRIQTSNSKNSRSRHSTATTSQSTTAARQGKSDHSDRPKSGNDAVVFLREKILAQENDRRKSKFALDTKNPRPRQRHVSRRSTSSGDSSSRSDRGMRSSRSYRKVRRRSKASATPQPTIAAEFSKFNYLKLPIIWSFGLTQISIAKNVQEVVEAIKRRHSFHEINLDLEILKWKTTPGFVKYSESVMEPSNFHDAVVFRASKILRKGSNMGMDSDKVSLSSSEICQLLKLSILSAQVNLNPRGYILKNFPVSTEEGIEFELLFYPSTAGLYFLNNHWSKNRKFPPDVYLMNHFTRIHSYSEYEVEKAADHFGSKTIKVSNAEDLIGKKIQDVVFLVQFHIKGDSDALKALADRNDRMNGALRRSKRSKGSTSSSIRKLSSPNYDKDLVTSKTSPSRS